MWMMHFCSCQWSWTEWQLCNLSPNMLCANWCFVFRVWHQCNIEMESDLYHRALSVQNLQRCCSEWTGYQPCCAIGWMLSRDTLMQCYEASVIKLLTSQSKQRYSTLSGEEMQGGCQPCTVGSNLCSFFLAPCQAKTHTRDGSNFALFSLDV